MLATCFTPCALSRDDREHGVLPFVGFIQENSNRDPLVSVVT